MQFGDFAGNAPVKQQLTALLAGGRIPHALLLEGPVGSGRRTLARCIARAAVCVGGGERPCGACSGCIKAAAGGHPDIVEVGGDGTARSFHIDAIRQLIEQAYVLPNEAPYRVFLLIGAHNMTRQAQNALLKILEEPPAHVRFVLTCDNRAQMLPTILSRTVCLSLTGVTEAEALPVLRARRPGVPDAEWKRALTMFGGVIGQALRGMEDGGFREVLELTPEVARALLEPDELPLLKLTARFEKDKELADGLLGSLQMVFRDALVQRCGGEADLSVAPDAAEQLARSLSKNQLAALLREVEDLQRARLHNMNATLFATVFCARLRRAAGR